MLSRWKNLWVSIYYTQVTSVIPLKCFAICWNYQIIVWSVWPFLYLSIEKEQIFQPQQLETDPKIASETVLSTFDL